MHQAIGALVDLQMADHRRVDFLEVTAAIGQIDRHTVLQQRHPAQVDVAPQTRAANHQPHFFGEARLGEHAGHQAQRVAKRQGVLVFEGFAAHHGHAAGHTFDLFARVAHHLGFG